MMSTETLTGHVKPDGTLELEHPSKLPAGRVEIILRSVPQTEATECTAGDNWWQYLRRVRAELAAGDGPFRSQAEIEGEREAFRDELYMAALSACRSNEVIRAFAHRLKAQGKLHKVVLTACMRKLLVILNTIVHTNTPWTTRLAAA